MPLDFTRALARLLASRKLRTRFVADRDQVLTDLDVEPAAREQLRSLPAADLEAQAAALITKRFHEVRRLLPQTFANLPADPEALFAEHAQTFWPKGHQRHLKDALWFADFLQNAGQPVLPAEVNRLRFRCSARWLALYRIPGEASHSGWLQILIRLATRVREYHVVLPFSGRVPAPPPSPQNPPGDRARASTTHS